MIPLKDSTIDRVHHHVQRSLIDGDTQDSDATSFLDGEPSSLPSDCIVNATANTSLNFDLFIFCGTPHVLGPPIELARWIATLQLRFI